VYKSKDVNGSSGEAVEGRDLEVWMEGISVVVSQVCIQEGCFCGFLASMAWHLTGADFPVGSQLSGGEFQSISWCDQIER
jgi:hypothetical protein